MSNPGYDPLTVVGEQCLCVPKKQAIFCFPDHLSTVDGQNPAPVGMLEALAFIRLLVQGFKFFHSI